MKIGVKNFRVFEEMAEFEIRPLTILVGPNNSGKSSFTKLLLLLKNGFGYLNFKAPGDHKIDNYKNAINRDSKSDEITLGFNFRHHFFDIEPLCEITYVDAHTISKFNVLNDIFQLEYDVKSQDSFDKENLLGNQNMGYDVKIKAQELIEFCKNILHNKLVQEADSFPFDIFNLNEVVEHKQFFIKNMKEKDDGFKYDLNIEDYFHAINLGDIQHLFLILRLAETYNKLMVHKAPYLFYDLYIDGENATEFYKEKLFAFQENFFSKISNGFCEDQISFNFRWDSFLQFFGEHYLKRKLNILIEKEFEGLFQNSIELKYSTLGEILFKEHLFTINKFQPPNYGIITVKLSFIEYLFYEMFDDLKALESTKFLSSKRGSQQRVFLENDYSFELFKKTQSSVKKYSSSLFDVFSKDNMTEEQFHNDILNIFGIKGEIVIKTFEDVLSVYIKNGDLEENLADLGLGFSQLVPLILYFKKDVGFTNTIIIEEPEANLHPALQSKLADLFVKINEYFPEINLVIETHSEYLIRKLQYLVASRQAKSENCIIHYFNANENVTQNEPKVKAIEIVEDGTLSDHFGSGFFDEVYLLQVQMRNFLKQNAN